MATISNSQTPGSSAIVKSDKQPKFYVVYILRCADNTLYTGITTDIKRRLSEHNSSRLGAKYTMTRRPVELVYSDEYPDRSTALRAEHSIKQLPRHTKLDLIQLKKT